MANNYQQDGTTLDYHNAGVDAVSSGALVAVVGTTLLSRLGEKGTLKQALTDINDQRNALTVVVRVADENDVAKRRAAVLKGIGTLSSAKSVTTYQPRIVIAPGFSEDDAIGRPSKFLLS